ncbi:MAG: sugar-binding protein [Victivallales bacterium]
MCNHSGAKWKIRLIALCVALIVSLIASAEPVLKVSSSRPNVNLFVLGEKVKLNFTAEGLEPGASLKLLLRHADEFDNVRKSEEVPVVADAAGRWTGEVEAPSSLFGFHKVFAELSNGVKLSGIGSRPSGWCCYAVVPDPSERPALKQSECFFGMQGGYNAKTMIVMPLLGIRWLNGGGPGSWAALEPTPGSLDSSIAKIKQGWDSHADHFNGSLSFEIDGKKLQWKTYGICWIYRPPDWAVKPGSRAAASAIMTDDGKKAWREYCRKGASLFADDGGEDEKHFYEITWEPNPPWGWKGTPDELVEIYRIAYEEIHKADPKAVITGPTLTSLHPGRGVELNEPLFAAGLGKLIDVFDCHPYAPETPEKCGYVETTRAIRDMLRRYCGRDIPMIGTESGNLQMPNTTEGMLRQARQNIRENLMLLGEGFIMNESFYLHDCSFTGPGGGWFMCETPKFFYGADLLAPKPAAAAYAAMTWILEGYKGASDITWLGDTALGYSYERNSSCVLALWDYSGTSRKVSIPTGAAKVMQYDWMGNGRSLDCAEGMLEVTLTEEPIYLKGVSSKLWGSEAVKPLRVRMMTEKVFPGDEARLEVTVSGPEGGEFNGELLMPANTVLELKGSNRKINLAIGKSESFSFTVKTPSTVLPGTYPVAFMLRSEKGTVAADGTAIRVLEPLRIEKIEPTVSKKAKAVRIHLSEQRDTATSGKVCVSLKGVPDSKTEQPFQLAAGKKQMIVMPFNDLIVPPTQLYPCEIAARCDNGSSTTSSIKLNFMIASKAGGNINLADEMVWQKVPVIKISGSNFLIDGRDNYHGDDDVNAELRYAWNNDALLVRCDVADDSFRQEVDDPTLAWSQDSVQLAFNLDPEKAGRGVTETVGLMRYTELTFAKTKQGDVVIRTNSSEPRYLPTGVVPAAEIQLKVKVEKGRVVYTMSIPWKTLGAARPLTAGDSLTVAALINDLDEGEKGTRTQLQLFGGIGDGKYPERFGWLVLGE